MTSSNHVQRNLHRTVRDFIKSSEAQDFLQSSMNLEFDPAIQLCVSFLVDSKRRIAESFGGQDGEPEIVQLLIVANFVQCVKAGVRVLKKNHGALLRVLDEHRRVVKQASAQTTTYLVAHLHPRGLLQKFSNIYLPVYGGNVDSIAYIGTDYREMTRGCWLYRESSVFPFSAEAANLAQAWAPSRVLGYNFLP